MTATRIGLIGLLLAALLTAGCTEVTVKIKQDDGTYKSYRKLVWKPSASDFTTFEVDKDHMVASELLGVTYGWPRGKGELVGLEEIDFRSDSLHCHIKKRSLTINGESFGEFKSGDLVKVYADGTVTVNDEERAPVAAE